MKIYRSNGMKTAGLACLCAAALAGCNSKLKPTPENYTTVLNSYFPDHPDCLFDGSVKFPLETDTPATLAQMNALVAAKLLEARKDPGTKVVRYTVTDAGTRAGRNFCYGHREVTHIDSSTPPAPANGFTETQVKYTYKIQDMPVWAKTPEVLAAFPKMATEAAGGAAGSATLALTGVGWSVPD